MMRSIAVLASSDELNGQCRFSLIDENTEDCNNFHEFDEHDQLLKMTILLVTVSFWLLEGLLKIIDHLC